MAKGWLPDLIGALVRVAGIEAVSRRTINFIAGAGVTITAEDNPGAEQTDVTFVSSAGSSGGSGSLTEDAPATQYVNADTGDDTAAGTELAPLATLGEARRRIGDKHGEATIYLDGAPGTQYQTASLGRARVGRRVLNVIGTPRIYEFEARAVTDVTGRVVTFDGASISSGAFKGWLAQLDAASFPLGCVIDNTGNTLTLADPPGALSTIGLFRPGVTLLESTGQYPICGGPNRDWSFDFLLLKNVEFQTGGTALFTGAITFDGCTVYPGSPAEIRDAFLKVGNSGVGLSMRGSFTNPGHQYLSNVRGTVAGMLGSVHFRGCGYDSANLIATGGAINLEATNSLLDLGQFDVVTGADVEIHGGVTVLSSAFAPGSAVATIDQYASVYCNSDLSILLGVDVSSAGAPIHDDWFTVQRLT